MWPEFHGLKNVHTMVICGQHSDMISIDALKNMQNIKPDLRIVSAEGQGHAPRLHLGNLAAEIADFLV